MAELVARAERGEIRMVRSPAHTFENDRNPREDRRLATASWQRHAARLRVKVANPTHLLLQLTEGVP